MHDTSHPYFGLIAARVLSHVVLLESQLLIIFNVGTW